MSSYVPNAVRNYYPRIARNQSGANKMVLEKPAIHTSLRNANRKSEQCLLPDDANNFRDSSQTFFFHWLRLPRDLLLISLELGGYKAPFRETRRRPRVLRSSLVFSPNFFFPSEGTIRAAVARETRTKDQTRKGALEGREKGGLLHLAEANGLAPGRLLYGSTKAIPLQLRE